MKKEHFIRDLPKLSPTEKFESVFLVQAKEIRHKKASGDQYLSLRLADRTGALDAKMWDNVSTFAHKFKEHDLVSVRGKVQLYNGNLQIIVHRIESIPNSDASLADFIPHTERDIETMYAEVLAMIETFENPHLKRLMGSIFKNSKFAAAYKRAPAARSMHHARIGGLLEHVSSVVKLAILVSSHYDDIDRDLLVSGVLLHDLGKIRELTSGPSFEYTDEGRLLGHIAIGSAWIGRRCDEISGFPPRLKSLLLHMVLSHHGKLEFGSPQVPQFAEALALHYIDDLDSKLEAMRAERKSISDGGVWTRFHRGLDSFVLDKDAYLRGEPGWSPPQSTISPKGERAGEETVAPPPRAPSPPPDLPVSEAVEPAGTPVAEPPESPAESVVQETVAAKPESTPDEPATVAPQVPDPAPPPDPPSPEAVETADPPATAAEPQETPAESVVEETVAAEPESTPDEPETLASQPPDAAPPPDLPPADAVELASTTEPEPEPPSPETGVDAEETGIDVDEPQALAADSAPVPEETRELEESEPVSEPAGEPPTESSASDDTEQAPEAQASAPEAGESQPEPQPPAKPAAEPLRPVPVESPNFVTKPPERAQVIQPPDLPVSDQSSLFSSDAPKPERTGE